MGANTEQIRGGLGNLRHFARGQSGNPRGRPKRDFEIAALAREHTRSAIAALVEIMVDRRAPPAARVQAASVLLDRGWGRAPQSIGVRHQLTLSDEFEEFVRSLQGTSESSITLPYDGAHASER